jgi:hypothetical protein
MTLYPDVAKKAQEEIDSVVGNDRLPSYADREYMPYVDALVKEVFRWNTVVPTGEESSSASRLAHVKRPLSDQLSLIALLKMTSKMVTLYPKEP